MPRKQIPVKVPDPLVQGDVRCVGTAAQRRQLAQPEFKRTGPPNAPRLHVCQRDAGAAAKGRGRR